MGQDNLLVVQSGGPTPVLNTSLCAVLAEAYRTGRGKVFGARYGMEGLVRGDLLDLTGLSPVQLVRLGRSPGAALGSSRMKPSSADLEGMARLLRKLAIHQVLFLGGNGTMLAAGRFGEFCKERGHEIRVIGVPKTIDNDIAGTDRCPGYASAARYVAQSTRDLAMDVCSLPQPVSILETMGRDVGWLAGASVTAKQDEGDAPHLVYVPEIPFALEAFLAALDSILKRQNWAIVVVSEGIRDKQGRPVYQTEEAFQADALKRPLPGGVARYLAQVVTRKLKVRCRDEKPGLLGRSSMLHASAQDLRDAEFVGTQAVRALHAGRHNEMVALTALETGGGPAGKLIPLESVATSKRAIPKQWLCQGTVPVNGEFKKYVRPLIGDLLEYGSIIHGVESYARG